MKTIFRAEKWETFRVTICATICVTIAWLPREFFMSAELHTVAMHDGISRACMKNHSFRARESAMWKQLNKALILRCFSFHSPSIFPFVDIDDYPFNSSFHQRIFQARSSCKELRIMSSNRRVSMPVNAVRRSPRRRTKTPSVNELSRKCSK